MNEKQIREAGEEHGRNAASWYFDGNTSRATYVGFLEGSTRETRSHGQPPVGPLSGEWTDGPTPSTLQTDSCLRRRTGRRLQIYEDGFYQASTDTIGRKPPDG